MRETDELNQQFETEEKSQGISRGTALKIGGIGLVGALAGLATGRRAGAAVKRKSSNASCAGSGFFCAGSNTPKLCGYDTGPTGTCFCGLLYYGKVRPAGAPIGACIENQFCNGGQPNALSVADACSRQRDCPPGTACITGTCCTISFKGVTYKNFCLPYCMQGSRGQAQPLTKPKTTAHK